MKCIRLASAIVLICVFGSRIAEAETVFLNRDGPSSYSVDVLESDDSHTLLRIRLNRFDVEQVSIEGSSFAQIRLGEATTTNELGYPDLPKLNRDVLIPFSSVPRLKIIKTKSKSFDFGKLIPSKGDLERSVNPASVPFTFGSIYHGDAETRFYPESLAAISRPFILRDVRGVTLHLRPFQYDTTTGKTRVVSELVVDIETSTPEGNTFVPLASGHTMVSAFADLYESRFANGKKFMALRDRNASSGEHAVKEEGGILIVSHDDFVSGLAPFVSWKRQRGFDVTVARLSESGATSTGIKNLIQSRYDADPSLAFVILAGDAGQVPFFPGTVGNAIGKEADPMYGLVAGADSYPDLIVARFAVQTSAELENIVSRSIRYEREPDLNGAWYARGMGIASNEGTPTDGERAELLRTMLESWRFTSVDRFYDPGVTAVGIANALNEGRSFINYIGHGSETGWVTGAFNNAQIDGLTNTDKLPIVISVACVNGNFNYANGDSFAERWLKAGTAAEPRGALAVFASSTNQSWVPPTVGQKEIVRLLTEERARTVGGLMMNGSVAVLEDASTTAVQTFQTWHIFGDPTIAIRTKAPIAIGAVVPQVWDASGTLAIETSEAGLTVTAIDGNRVLARGISGVHGEVTLRLDPSLVSTQRVLVTVTGRDRVPVEVVVNVD